MQTPLERAARALCVSGGFDPDEIMANDGPRWRYYAPNVRIVLMAIREPTNEIIEAGYLATDLCPAARCDTRAELAYSFSVPRWQAMLDTALKDE